jgi:hypothetical protein
MPDAASTAALVDILTYHNSHIQGTGNSPLGLSAKLALGNERPDVVAIVTAHVAGYGVVRQDVGLALGLRNDAARKQRGVILIPVARDVIGGVPERRRGITAVAGDGRVPFIAVRRDTLILISGIDVIALDAERRPGLAS